MTVAQTMFAFAAYAALAAIPAHAQGLRAVEPLPGYACAKINATDAQMMNPNGSGIVVRPSPRHDATPGVEAPSVLIVREPRVVINGFVQVLQFNRREGWIEGRHIKPMDPFARCTPSVMSNGKLGIG